MGILHVFTDGLIYWRGKRLETFYNISVQPKVRWGTKDDTQIILMMISDHEKDITCMYTWTVYPQLLLWTGPKFLQKKTEKR